MTATVRLETIKAFKNFLFARGIKYTESNGYFTVSVDNKEDELLTKEFFRTRQIKFSEKVTV